MGSPASWSARSRRRSARHGASRISSSWAAGRCSSGISPRGPWRRTICRYTARSSESSARSASGQEGKVADKIQIGDKWYVAAMSGHDDRAQVLKNNETFALFDRYGDIQAMGQPDQGLYHGDTRFLSHQAAHRARTPRRSAKAAEPGQT